MRKIAWITLLVFIGFWLEFFLFNFLGPWFTPQLLILMVIFFNLTLGIRYSLYTAFGAGLLKDSFSTGFFGLNIFAYIVCAYMTTIISKYVYLNPSRSSRLLIVALVALLHVFIQTCLYFMFFPVDLIQVIKSILFPEVVMTLIVSIYFFKKLKQCASRLFA
ncbi:MAG: rod shape-determining protein MreD [Candidatus Omnitrophota bacterium]|nr:rod shape-determining protein MreD [Candidatus Omnitrophota bacterium]